MVLIRAPPSGLIKAVCFYFWKPQMPEYSETIYISVRLLHLTYHLHGNSYYLPLLRESTPFVSFFILFITV